MFELSTWLVIGSGGLLGLMSIPHCALMCGPVAGVAGCSKRQLGRYHLGRGMAYALVGAGLGSIGDVVNGSLPTAWSAALVSWVLALSLAFSAYRLWRGSRAEPLPSLVTLNPAGPKRTLSLWSRVLKRLPREGAFYGFMTALLPCGALYGAYGIAAATGSAWAGAVSMALFAAASSLGLVAAGLLARSLRRTNRSHWVRVVAAFLAVGAVVLVVRPLPTLVEPAAPPTCCEAP